MTIQLINLRPKQASNFCQAAAEPLTESLNCASAEKNWGNRWKKTSFVIIKDYSQFISFQFQWQGHSFGSNKHICCTSVYETARRCKRSIYAFWSLSTCQSTNPSIILKQNQICDQEDNILETPGQRPLKVPNVEFDFDVSVDIIQLPTATWKSNLKLWVLFIACKWVC